MWMLAVVLVVVVALLVVAKRMKIERVVVVALLCAVVGMPQVSSAAGSYGAVVEKGFRGCTIAPESGVVICFQSLTVNSRSRGMFLQASRAADLSLARWDTGPATLFVRAFSVSADRPPSHTYLASADLVMPRLACRGDFRFRVSEGVVGLESFAGACTP